MNTNNLIINLKLLT